MHLAIPSRHLFPPRAPPRPPKPAPLLSRNLSPPRTNPPPKLRPPLILPLPILRAVNLPPLTEIRRKRFGQEEQLHKVAAGRYIFFRVFLPILDDAVAGDTPSR